MQADKEGDKGTYCIRENLTRMYTNDDVGVVIYPTGPDKAAAKQRIRELKRRSVSVSFFTLSLTVGTSVRPGR